MNFFLTTNRGLYKVEGGNVVLVDPVPCHGIDAQDGQLYVVRRTNKNYPGWTGVFRGQGSQEWEQITWVEKGTYEIKWRGDKLWICVTGRNEVLEFPIGGKEYEAHTPNGFARREDGNYQHFNSILHGEDWTEVLAHNYSGKSDRPSCVWRYQDNVWRITKIDVGRECHDWTEKFYNDSGNRALKSRMGDVLKTWDEGYPRGLEYDEEVVVVGISKLEPDRDTREGDTFGARMDILDRHTMTTLDSIPIPAGQIYCIKGVD